MDLLPTFLRKVIFKLTLAAFGENSYIDYGCFIRYPWRVKVASNVVINKGVKIYPSYLVKGTFIEIGARTIIAPEVMILGAGHSLEITLPDVSADIKIGEDCFIGAGSIIRYGIQIGNKAVVAAGSVVVKDIPPGEVHGGNPASFIRMRF